MGIKIMNNKDDFGWKKLLKTWFLMILLLILSWISISFIRFFYPNTFLAKIGAYLLIFTTLFVIIVISVTFLGGVYGKIKLPKLSINKTQHKEISLTEKLSSLKKLNDSGVITNEEFKKKRKKILDEF